MIKCLVFYWFSVDCFECGLEITHARYSDVVAEIETDWAKNNVEDWTLNPLKKRLVTNMSKK